MEAAWTWFLNDAPGQAIPVLRWTMLLIAIPIACGSFGGFLAFPRNIAIIPGIRALIFLGAASAVSFNSGYLIEGVPMPEPHPRTIFSLSLFMTFLVLSGLALFWLRKVENDRTAILISAVEATGPVADLWAVDPAAARRLAAEARKLTREAHLKTE